MRWLARWSNLSWFLTRPAEPSCCNLSRTICSGGRQGQVTAGPPADRPPPSRSTASRLCREEREQPLGKLYIWCFSLLLSRGWGGRVCLGKTSPAPASHSSHRPGSYPPTIPDLLQHVTQCSVAPAGLLCYLCTELYQTPRAGRGRGWCGRRPPGRGGSGAGCPTAPCRQPCLLYSDTNPNKVRGISLARGSLHSLRANTVRSRGISS